MDRHEGASSARRGPLTPGYAAGVARPVRVIHVVTRMNVGGPARHLITLLPLLRERGFETLLVYGAADPAEGELRPERERFIRLPMLRRAIGPIADLRALSRLTRLMRRLRPDVVHTHMAKGGAPGRVGASRSRVPAVVHTFHGHVLERYFSRPMNALLIGAERGLAERSDALVAVSSAVRDDLLRLRIGDAGRWRVIDCGLDLEPLLASDVDQAEARRALGLPGGVPAVGIVGRLVPIKNHRLFLDAARAVLDEHPDTVFVVAGDGELRATLETEAEQALRGHVSFTGWVVSLPLLYSALDVVVLTSLNEGIPFSLIEAAAAAKPVVATDVGGVADAVVDGETGFLVSSKKAPALARAISRLIADPGLAAKMGEAGRRRASTAFSPAVMADRIGDLYREVLAGKHPQG